MTIQSTALRVVMLATATLALASPVSAQRANARLSDAQVKQAIIRQSIDSYPGNCPCPYSTMRNGRSCGGRSAYNRGGGYAPVCYARDVTAADVAAYRRSR